MKKYISEIYIKVFKRIRYMQIDVFLCGGASSFDKKTRKVHKSYRDMFRENLRLVSRDRLNIYYPEDMFMELLAESKYDLLTMEQFLANNSDVILIIPESPGSFAELGAFVNNEHTMSKVFVLQQEKFKRVPSFITQGPISYMANYNKGRIIYFNKDIQNSSKNVVNRINSSLRKIVNGHKRIYIPFKDIDSLTGIINFEILILYFYESISYVDLNDSVNEAMSIKYAESGLDRNKKYEEILMNASLKFLFKNGWIEKNDSDYKLTHKGIIKACSTLKRSYAGDIDGIRISIMQQMLY